MTREELKEYRHLQKTHADVLDHIKQCKEQLYQIEENTFTSDDDISAVSLSRTEQKILLRAREERLKDLEKDIAEQSKKVEDFIFSIKSIRLRHIFILRYIDCYSWLDVAANLGFDSTADGVRMEHDRYLKQIEK